MNLFTKLIPFLALLAAFTLSSCEKEEVDLNIVPVNGMTVTLTPAAGGQSQSFTMSTTVMDDGIEHGVFKEEHIRLQPNTTYNATITFFSDKDGIRKEQNESIKREEAYYTVKYLDNALNESSLKTDVEVNVTDTKSDGSPLGFNSTFRTGNAGIDALHVELAVYKSKGKSSMAGTVYNATYWIDVQN